jgi:hypothetical protein
MPMRLEYILIFWYNMAAMDEKQKKELLEKIESTVYSADRFNEMSFRMVLEGMVNKGGEDAEFLFVKFLSAQDLELNTRINIIRVVGYLQSTHFLIPLKKIIDKEENTQLKKEAIISVAKYNNRQALNILNHALNHIKNPMLLQVINNEIGKIKKNNPIFGLLPRFNEGERDPKNFRVTVDILKRILNPTDAGLFTGYLDCGRKLIENGAFEILCSTGDERVQEQVLKFFQDRFVQIPCVTMPECEEFYSLVAKLKQYFTRNLTLVDAQVDNLGTQLLYVKDIRIRELFISIICRSHKTPAITFMSGLYDSELLLRKTIIREFAGNDSAVDLLFEKYKSDDGSLKPELVQSLLSSKKGIDYFNTHFDSLPPEEQHMIVNSLPYGKPLGRDLGNFFSKIFRSPQAELKTSLLTRVKENYEFSVRNILFDPDLEDDFFTMEQAYLDTITHLFPISTVKKMLERVVYDELPLGKTRRYISQITELAGGGLVFLFRDNYFVNALFQRIITLNSPDLNILFLNLLNNFRIFDMETYKNIDQAVGMFLSNKNGKLSSKENVEYRKIRKNLNELYYEVKAVEEGFRVLSGVMSQNMPDAERIGYLINKHSLGVSLLMERMQVVVEKQLMEAGTEALNQWVQVFRRFPMIGYRVREAIIQKASQLHGFANTQLIQLLESLPSDPVKIVVRLNDRRVTAVLKDQCKEIIPDIPVDAETDTWREGDLLVCDSETFKDFILKNEIPSQKLFLFLDKRSDFSTFKSYNPRPLVKPFSAYRIIKEILKDLYI